MPQDYPDFEGGKRGVYSIAEWAAMVGDAKELTLSFTSRDLDDAEGAAAYIVPAGKTLYITRASALQYAAAIADADNQERFKLSIAGGTNTLYIGGNGGGSWIISPPIVIESEDTLSLSFSPKTNHKSSGFAVIGGYEVAT